MNSYLTDEYIDLASCTLLQNTIVPEAGMWCVIMSYDYDDPHLITRVYNSGDGAETFCVLHNIVFAFPRKDLIILPTLDWLVLKMDEVAKHHDGIELLDWNGWTCREHLFNEDDKRVWDVEGSTPQHACLKAYLELLEKSSK